MAYESKPGTGSSYDQSLLANAPEATRAEKQVRSGSVLDRAVGHHNIRGERLIRSFTDEISRLYFFVYWISFSNRSILIYSFDLSRYTLLDELSPSIHPIMQNRKATTSTSSNKVVLVVPPPPP